MKKNVLVIIVGVLLIVFVIGGTIVFMELTQQQKVIQHLTQQGSVMMEQIGLYEVQIKERDELLERYRSMNRIVNTIEDAGVIVNSLEDVTAALALASKAPFGSPFKDDFVITSPFGLRDESLWHGDGNHAGIDLIPVGGDKTIYYTADGIIESYDYDETYGWNMWVNHGDYKTHYAHLRLAHYPIEGSTQIVGAEVKQGNRLGQMGASGFSYGAHLHYEIWVKGDTDWLLLDPTEILRYLG